MTRTTKINLAVGALLVFTAAVILYFNGLLRQPADQAAPLNSIASNAGTPAETDANGPAYAQFRADCMLNTGASYRGTVSVPAMQSPRELKAVELKDEKGNMVRFAQADANCTYSPY